MELIILVNQNLNQTNVERYNLRHKQSGLKKLFWSILYIENKKLFFEYKKTEYRPKKNKNFINIKSYYELYKNIKKVKRNTYFLNKSGSSLKSMLIELIMKLKGCIILKKIEWHEYTHGKENFTKKISRIYEFGLIFTLKKIFNTFCLFINKFLLKIFSCRPNYFIIENQSRENNFKNKKINNFIKVNSFHYSTCEKIKSKKNSKNYFVFLDSELENSWESKVLKNRCNFINHFKYWKCLDNIFDLLSKNFKIDTKIAAHFRRSKNNVPIKKNFYFDQTSKLIKNSKFVVVQSSSAIDMAILLKKPILLLNFKVFDSISLENSDSIKFYRDKLSLEMVNVDLNYNFNLKKKMNSLLNINNEKYQKFSKFYLNYKTPQFPHLNEWDMIYNKFK